MKKAPDRYREAFFAKVYMKRKLFQFYGEFLQVFVGGTAPDEDLILSRLSQYIAAGTIVECKCFGSNVTFCVSPALRFTRLNARRVLIGAPSVSPILCI